MQGTKALWEKMRTSLRGGPWLLSVDLREAIGAIGGYLGDQPPRTVFRVRLTQVIAVNLYVYTPELSPLWHLEST